MEPASCHPFGAQNMMVALRFVDNLCPPAVNSCQKDGCTEVFPRFDRDQRVSDSMTCNSVCVTVNVPSLAQVGCDANCSQDYVQVLLQVYILMRGYTCYKLRYSVLRQLYIIPSNMQQNPSPEATGYLATL
jgi:hypothetical protein